MKLSKKIKARLVESQNDPVLLLYWIIAGINSGKIHGDADELKAFIHNNLKDPQVLECMLDNKTIITELFYKNPDYDALDEKTLACIKITFDIFQEKNPLAFLKFGINRYQSESALMRIARYPKFIEVLETELDKFIQNYSHKLNENELLTLANALHNNPKLIASLMERTQDLLNLQRNCFSQNQIENAIQSHWSPIHKNEPQWMYQNFPVSEMWRLFMDGDQQNIGWKNYEHREPRCINQLYLAWEYIQKTRYIKLSPAYFQQLHAICAKGIIKNSVFVGAYRECKPSFGMTLNSTTFLGYLEHLTELQSYSSIERKPYGIAFIASSNIPTSKLDPSIQKIIEDYEFNMLSCEKEPLHLLKAIILLCKKLVHIHPFEDCNGRLFCNLILNRELVRHGFSPTLLDNPNRLDGYSIEEAVSEVIRGMYNFQGLMNDLKFKGHATQEFLNVQAYPIPALTPYLSQNLGATPLNFFDIPLEKEVQSILSKSPPFFVNNNSIDKDENCQDAQDQGCNLF